MEEQSPPPSLERVLSSWPVASSLSQFIPVGDLITLARLSVTLRALLHGFDSFETTLEANALTAESVRTSIRIGRHATPSWQRLKARAPLECSSLIHTKGSEPRPCKYCSRPICDACIVRDSFAKGHENTFQNRIRYLCKSCWESGSPSRSQRFQLVPQVVPAGQSLNSGAEHTFLQTRWYDPTGSTRDYCTCTLKDDGSLCLECKDRQNNTAITTDENTCHGQCCNNTLQPEEKSRYRICLWCNKSLPRQVGGTTRHQWTQKIIEDRARTAASRQSDLEEYNRKRLRERTMSRREMRGDEAVKDDADADVPQFVRHLDTINYRTYMSEREVPSPETVFASKTGYWRYGRSFLLAMQRHCEDVLLTPQLETLKKDILQVSGHSFARTNLNKENDADSLSPKTHNMTQAQLLSWNMHKAVILEYLLIEKLSYETTRHLMREEHGFEAEIDEYYSLMHIWTTQEHMRKYRRQSLEDEVAALPTEKRSGTLGMRKIPYIDGQSIENDSEVAQGSTSTPIDRDGQDHDSQLCQTDSIFRTPSAAPTLPPIERGFNITFDFEAPPSPSAEGSVQQSTMSEEPPPYSPDGWIWPGNAGDEMDL